MAGALTLSVLNTKEELEHLAVMAPITLEFSGNISLVDALNKIKVIRLDDSEGYSNLPFSFSDYLKYDETKFSDLSISANGNKVTVAPKDSWINGSQYSLFVSKGIVSTNSAQNVKSEKIKEFDTKDGSISFTVKSYSPTTGKIAGYITSGTTVYPTSVYDIKSKITTYNGYILLDDNYTYSSGEVVKAEKHTESVLQDDVIVNFNTVKTGVYEPPAIKSETIKKEDVVNFFNNPLINKNAQTQTQTTTEDKELYEAISILPNKLVFDFDSEVDKDSLDLSSIEFELGEAFDNYHLSKMGFYKDVGYRCVVYLKKKSKRLEFQFYDDESVEPGKVLFEWGA